MWFNWDRPNKAYDLEGFSQDSGVKSGGKSDFLVDDVDRLLVTRLNDLMIAENHESDSEKEDDEDEEVRIDICMQILSLKFENFSENSYFFIYRRKPRSMKTMNS